MATQRRLKKIQREQTLTAVNTRTEVTVSRSDEDGPCGSKADLRSLPVKIIGGCSSVNGDVLNDNKDETVSEINTPVPRSEVDGKTYTDLEVPTTSSWRANDPERRPEQIEDLARQSTRYNDSKGGTEDAVFRDPTQVPWEYIVTEAAPKNICSSEILVPLPFHLHPRHPNSYACPPFLVSLCPPTPGAFQGAVGFPHLPPGTIVCPPKSWAPQDGPMAFFASYATHPFGCGEGDLLLHDYHLSNWDGVSRI
ncbi:hypothetical protein P4O66_003010 [Electrophorus voltai]|uniref:Uncharacterized protein n=1 Tax=Electrophorus voltai TaxID=2609070 RepID=A0AAD9DMQ9_9TELE|nr:hypothetical protein P4O66_003010 [Electrophorus voltai]